MEYQHGGDIYTNSVTMDYSANINPLGVPAGVRRAVCQAADQCFCYPDSQSASLRGKLAKFHEIPMETIICGNGAADLIFQVVTAVRPKEALLIAPSFLEYEQALRSVSCGITYYELKEEEEFALREQELIAWIEESSHSFQMIFLCNPNNPTGFALKKEQLHPLLDYCREKRIFLVLDECFNEFLEDPHRHSALEFLRKGSHEQVFLLKAFTKIYAMAGIRLGYGICKDSTVLEKIHQIRQPWSVSSIAQAAGEAALEETAYVEAARSLIACEREYLKDNLTALGFRVYDSKANYIFFKDLRTEALQEEKLLYRQLLVKKVLIRSCANYRGLDGTFYRICVKQREENEAFLSVLKSILTERK
ncbi:pyridoxal phosphate-dependent aminotransferase [Lacrimispora sp. JR3]|uniref:pyridoxal phosphate-dependent aminotransferase n=1 Tax=Lacrimispora sinapis TaxID=3111456 RepID=UPI003747E3A6